MVQGKKVAIVLPAYNAERTLERTWEEVPKNDLDVAILVDDASADATVEIARRLGMRIVTHEQNRGYGANQKTCYREALAEGADVVVMLHPDYQYDPRLLPYLVGLIADGVCDVVLGNRIRTRQEALAGGMPRYKYVANRFLTLVENLVTGQNLGEWHSGLRAYSARSLRQLRWAENSDDFIFDQQFLLQASAARLRIADVPCPARYLDEASSISFRRSTRYGLLTLWCCLRYALHRTGAVRCALLEPLELEPEPAETPSPAGAATDAPQERISIDLDAATEPEEAPFR